MGKILLFAFVSTLLWAQENRFELTGHYWEESTGMRVTIDDNRHLEISMVAWDYPNPLMSDGGSVYRTTGYYPSGGCKVPVKTVLDYDAKDKKLFVEFHHPTSIISGLFSCHFLGDRVESHQFVVGENVTQDWERAVEGQGCGKNGAKASLQKQIQRYMDQCNAQTGKPSHKTDPRPSCFEPDPNDIQCPAGHCWWRGRFFCKFS